MKTLLPLSLSSLLIGASCGAAVPMEAQLLKFKHSSIRHSVVDGVNDDLLSAGLGHSGLANPVGPTLSEPPSAQELRRRAIHTNYRAIVSTSAAAGFGSLYGPRPGQAPIAGDEYHSSLVGKGGELLANYVIQVPASFNPAKPCIVAAPSSGSRGVWGAIGTAADWGLRRGCAVALTDKGSGSGFTFLDNSQSYDGDGRLQQAQQTPTDDLRVAVKHAHSGRNIEQHWGHYTLQGVQMAFYLLNQHHRQNQAYYTRANTRVIATSISNGGNSVLRAGELNSDGWLDAIVASEPTIVLPQDFSYTVQSKHNPHRGPSKNILAMALEQALYQPCALAGVNPGQSVFMPALAVAQKQLSKRCDNLAAAGFISASDLPKAARSAMKNLGLALPSPSLQAFAQANQLWESVAVGYSNAYASARAEDSICGFDYRHFKDGKAASMPTAARHKLFGLSSGMPNTAGLNLAYNGKPIPRSDSEPLDPHFNGLLCLREYYRSNATQAGINALAHSGDLHNTPTIIIQGEHDALVIANHNARGYLAWRQHKLPARNNLRYYEIARAQHFDALLGLAEFSADFIPLHHYYEQALELMWQHLETGAPLPPHQWVATKAATPLKASDLPPIQAKPGALAIRVNENSVNIPN